MSVSKRGLANSVTITNSGRTASKTPSDSVISPFNSPKMGRTRPISYSPFFFADKKSSGSMQYNPPSNNGVRNQNYVNPSFKSSDCFNPIQEKPAPRSPLAKLLSDSVFPISSQNTVSAHKKSDSVFFRPTSKDTYIRTMNHSLSIDFNDFFESVAVGNKHMSLQNRRKKLQEAEKEKTLEQRVQECNNVRNSSEDQRQATRKEAIKRTLPANISIANAKREAVKNRSQEDLSSFVETSDKPELKAYLEVTTTQKGVLNKVADSAQKLSENRKNDKQASDGFNKQKGLQEVEAKKSGKRVDNRNNHIDKLGNPGVYTLAGSEDTVLTELGVFYSPKSGSNKPLLIGEEKTQAEHAKKVNKTFSHYNPEVQRRSQQKLNDFLMKETHKFLCKDNNVNKYPYSSVSKYLKEFSKSNIKY